MNHRVVRVLAAAGTLTFCCAATLAPSKALEKPKVYRGMLILEGIIEPGDYFSVRNFLSKKSNFQKISGGVFLASPGGHINEAMKIGHLIRALQLSTDAPPGPRRGALAFGEPAITRNNLVNPNNYLCTSACFLIYVAGVRRHLTSAGRLGVHRPTILKRALRHLDSERAKFAEKRIRSMVKQYLDEMDVPEKYLDLMFSVPPNKVRWITQAEFDSDLKGYIAKLKQMIDAQCQLQDESANQKAEHSNCTAGIEQPMAAWRKIFADQ
jgi:hypothetical protein